MVDISILDSVAVDGREIIDYAVVSRQSIIDGDKYYSQSTRRWAEGLTGYDEQVFGAGSQADI